MLSIEHLIEDGTLNVVVRPNAPRTEIAGQIRGMVKVNVNAPPEKSRANYELVKYLNRLLRRRVKIVSGLGSRQKKLKIY